MDEFPEEGVEEERGPSANDDVLEDEHEKKLGKQQRILSEALHTSFVLPL